MISKRLKRYASDPLKVRKRSKYPTLEQEIYEIFVDYRTRGNYLFAVENTVFFIYFFVVVRCSTGRIVSQKLLKDLMREKVQALDAGTTFKVSNGWIVRFCSRFRLTSRRITGSGKKLP